MITRGSINESDAAGCYQKRQISKKPLFFKNRDFNGFFYKWEAELCGTKSKIKQKIYIRTLEQALFCAKQIACMFKHDTREDMVVFFFLLFFPSFFLDRGDDIYMRKIYVTWESSLYLFSMNQSSPCIKMGVFFRFPLMYFPVVLFCFCSSPEMLTIRMTGGLLLLLIILIPRSRNPIIHG